MKKLDFMILFAKFYFYLQNLYHLLFKFKFKLYKDECWFQVKLKVLKLKSKPIFVIS